MLAKYQVGESGRRREEGRKGTKDEGRRRGRTSCLQGTFFRGGGTGVGMIVICGLTLWPGTADIITAGFVCM